MGLTGLKASDAHGDAFQIEVNVGPEGLVGLTEVESVMNSR